MDLEQQIRSRRQNQINQIHDMIEKGGKALPLGTIRKRPNGNFIKTASGWKYHSASSKSASVGTAAKEASSKSLLTQSEGNLISKDGESLSYRIYKDGGVKIEGLNVRKDFSSKKEADSYISKTGIKSKSTPHQDAKITQQKQEKGAKNIKRKSDLNHLEHLQKERNDLYNRGYKDQAAKVQKDIDKRWAELNQSPNQYKVKYSQGGPSTTFNSKEQAEKFLKQSGKLGKVVEISNTEKKSSSKHISDMSKTEKQKAAEKLGIDIKGKTDAQLNKEMISANIDKQIGDFKASKQSKIVDSKANELTTGKYIDTVGKKKRVIDITKITNTHIHYRDENKDTWQTTISGWNKNKRGDYLTKI